MGPSWTTIWWSVLHNFLHSWGPDWHRSFIDLGLFWPIWVKLDCLFFAICRKPLLLYPFQYRHVILMLLNIWYWLGLLFEPTHSSNQTLCPLCAFILLHKVFSVGNNPIFIQFGVMLMIMVIRFLILVYIENLLVVSHTLQHLLIFPIWWILLAGWCLIHTPSFDFCLSHYTIASRHSTMQFVLLINITTSTDCLCWSWFGWMSWHSSLCYWLVYFLGRFYYFMEM